MYYWAREFSTGIAKGNDYIQLPRTIIISIINFPLFDCKEFHSEFQVLDVVRHTQLTDKMSLHYFELPKLPQKLNANSYRDLWLQLFKANTQEELAEIEALEVPVMSEAIKAYESIIATSPDFKEIERLKHKAEINEAYALADAAERGEKRGEKRANQKWLKVVDEKDAELASKDAEIAELKAELVKAELKKTKK